MTTATELITDGFREGNLIPIGTTPTEAEQTEGLAVLNRYLKSMYGYCIGENLADWPVPAVQRTGSVAANPPLYPGSQNPLVAHNVAYPAENRRIVWDGTDQTIYFPEKPDNGARMALVMSAAAAAGTLTIDGNGRLIEGAASYSSATATSRRWLYRADLANWKALETLALTDDNPFPDDFDDFWICAIALRLAPRYGRDIKPGTVETYRRMKSTIKAHYAQSEPGTSGGIELYPSHQSHGPSDWFDPF